MIGFSVVYKAFENMDGFKRVFGFQPNTQIAVLVFGFFHGFGLATKLQDFALSPNGLVTNIVSFNVGVEIARGDILQKIDDDDYYGPAPRKLLVLDDRPEPKKPDGVLLLR